MMRPEELSPLTAFYGSDIRLEEAVRSSCTFLLWERSYGVATVSPTADKMILYCLQQRKQTPAADLPAERGQKNVFLLQRPQTGENEEPFIHDASILEGGRGGVSTLFRTALRHFSSEALPRKHKEVFGEGNSIATLEDYNKETNNTTMQRESPLSLHERRKCQYYSYLSEVDHRPLFTFPPAPSQPSSSPLFMPSVGQGCPSTSRDIFLSKMPYRAVAEETTLQFQEDNVMEKHLDSGVVHADFYVTHNPASDALNLGDGNDDNNNEGSDISGYHAAGVRVSSGMVCYPQPDPTRLTSNPASQWPRWENSIEPRRVTDEEVLDGALGDGKDGNEEEIMLPEDVSAQFDSEQAMVYSEGSPSFRGERGVSPSFSIQPQFGTVSSETPVGRKPDDTTVGMTPVTQLDVVDEPKRKTRRYCPPAFYCTRVADTAEAATGEREVDCEASGSRGNSFLIKKSPEDVSAIFATETACHGKIDDTMTPPTTQGRISSAPTEKTFSSPFSEDLRGKESNGRCSPEMNITNDTHGDGQVTCPLSLGEGRKEASPLALPQEPCSGPNSDQFEETRIFPSSREANEKPLSVSPSPSFKDYEWAAKAQEAFEQQQKRFCARTPSTNPPSPPPPLQVGGFELPQLPRGRHLDTPVSCNAKGDDVISKESSQSATKGHRSLRAPPDGVKTPTNELATQMSTKPISQTAPLTRRAASSQRQLSGTPKSAAVTRKRSRHAVMSPTPKDEFPLPRTMPASESAARKKKSRKERTKK
ncbi:hypothetical protein C3747_124g54 [Trypanosoma cruzi]|uniref:Uncharacterized protein n=2 Tax=Trypanosoma cruzi TaxID=5693 RepID=Q4DR72_TRYCC|nr:hypothetical protein, conserved [Trypanosoma cruzi]EAN95017.1 hypothetical protein, conserved [Trypanosoma cruzi]KAF8289443.1 hypothetical protein TcYC6_0025900 [Trypanosoma cruzi]PWV05794.1 hypothetical protein C3747_124g54 [Trypanosoma cruzi]|eukprot:XP_816868.1 hypothetical protein [Trypanosoma cruzi strain CL Brener]